MDPLLVVDVGLLVRDLAIATQRRLEAAKRLPETVSRVNRTMGHVVGAIDDVQMDKGTETVLNTIKGKLNEVNSCLDQLEKTGDRGGKGKTVLGRCCGLMSQGHDVLAIEAKFDELDAEIKNELQELVKATQLHAYANRAAGVLSHKSARAFWDKHFKDARSAPADDLLEALRFEAGEAVDFNALDPVVRLALGCDGADGASPAVSVLKFGETFGEAPLVETFAKLAQRRSAATHLVQVRVYRLPSKKEEAAQSFALLLRVTDSLADLRHAIKSYASEALEEEGEGAVAAYLVDGAFELYLDSTSRPWLLRTQCPHSSLRGCVCVHSATAYVCTPRLRMYMHVCMHGLVLLDGVHWTGCVAQVRARACAASRRAT